MTELSAAAIEFRARVSDPARFLETCEGGDAGSPQAPSIWFLGIEPAWNKEQQATENDAGSTTELLMEAYGVQQQLKFQYNQKAFKLLAAINGLNPREYKDFALSERPFERGAKGYFKANLFPEPFPDVATWEQSAGFESKEEYRKWMREHRLPVMKAWIERCRPKMVVGTSTGHLHDFMFITGTTIEPEAIHFKVKNSHKHMYVATSGTVPMFVTPHLIGQSGLNSFESKQFVATEIRKALEV